MTDEKTMVSISPHILFIHTTFTNHYKPQNECLTAQDWLARFQRNEGRFNGCSEYPSEFLNTRLQPPHQTHDHYFHRLG